MKTWLRIAGLCGVATVVIAGLFLVWHGHAGEKSQPKLTAYFDSPAEQAKYLPIIADYLKGEGLSVAVSATPNADIVVGQQKLAHYAPVSSQVSGQPVTLNKTSGQLVQVRSVPDLYISSNRGNIGPQDSSTFVGNLGKQLSQLQASNTWTLNAVGDIIEGRYVYRTMRLANNYTLPFSQTYHQLSSSDLTLANLECTIADGIAYPEKGFTFNAPAKSMNGLTEAGIDGVNLANNHSYSEPVGFNAMLKNLDRAGIKHFGGGPNVAAAHTPAILRTHGLKIALLGYDAIPGPPEATATSGGVAAVNIAPWYKWDEARIKAMQADIAAAKKQANLVFVYYHWGTEYTHQANDQQRQVAHRAIDAGADLILGTHPHWVQGVEWYHGKLITYSLGNFIFDQEWSVPTTQGTMLSATFDGTKLVSAKLTPYHITNYSTPGWLDAKSVMYSTILNDVYSHSWWPNL